MKIKKVMEHYGICRQTVSRWVNSGKIDVKVLPSGRYDYFLKDEASLGESVPVRSTVLYARVSTSGERENLLRQVERLKSFASARGYVVDEVYSEVGSALNYNRRYYRRLYGEIVGGKVGRVVVEYTDRLLRLGFDDFEHLCKLHGVELVVVDTTVEVGKTKHQEITDDMIAIIHHFSSKMYSSRKRKAIIELMKAED